MSTNMTDDEFVDTFLQGSLPPTAFHHRDHVRLSWFLVRERGVEEASQIIAAGIRQFAARHGQERKYHETLTRFWVRIVGHHVEARSEITEFAAFLDAFPWLLDKDLPSRHWRRETMGEESARAGWVEPDLLALPV